MNDRIPTYPGRVLISPENGAAPFYAVMTMADEPTQAGTPPTKANLLTDDTETAIFGNTENRTVNNALFGLYRRTCAEVVFTGVPGTRITLSKGGAAFTQEIGQGGSSPAFYLPQFGEWNASYTYLGETWSGTIDVPYVSAFSFDCTPTAQTAPWGLIGKLSEAGLANTYFSLGDKKSFTLGGVSYEAQIIGFNHDILTAGGTAGITWQMVDCLNTTYAMYPGTSTINRGGWADMPLRATIAGFLSQLPADLRAAIKPVNKLSSAGLQSSNIVTTSDSLFLLSEIEIFGSVSQSFAGEGTRCVVFFGQQN